mgnify:CR=1 FL=1
MDMSHLSILCSHTDCFGDCMEKMVVAEYFNLMQPTWAAFSAVDADHVVSTLFQSYATHMDYVSKHWLGCHRA